MGVRTTKVVKKIGCSNLKQMVEDDKLVIEDYDTINELSTFIVKGSSFEVDDGCNDDMVGLFVYFELVQTKHILRNLQTMIYENKCIEKTKIS